jgi:uncharacterized protein with ACT and thioredoxin-like domain
MNTFDVILTLIKNNPITWIWSYETPSRLTENNFVVHIRTFIHDGYLMVIYDELKETFDILLLDNNMNIIETITDVHISQIVNEIHNAIFGMPKGNVDLEVCRNSLN